ncbi:MAG: DNA polymerase III subunit delta [Oscillospiraceae bacterium]|nr:DNA polymerase III subunit delta [Oscillospiraceae bacterium]
MAEKKRTADAGYQKFKQDLAAGEIGSVYVFHGEESYLREFYLKALREKIVPAGFEEFNYHALQGKGLSIDTLAECVEAMPMMAERTLVTVTDCDLFKLPEDQRGKLIALLEDFPEYCCLVFVYDIVEYKPNKTYKKLCDAISKAAQTVKFEAQEKGDLINWIFRRFKATGHDISAAAAEHLIFTCGGLMTGLVPEIEKIASYAKGKTVTVEDINTIADPILDAVVFDITNAVTKGNYDRACELLGQLLKKQEEPIMLLAAISKELRRIYTARIAIDSGKDKFWLMDLWNMRSDYPAKLLLEAARKTTGEWCRNSLELSQKLDRRMKSETGIDREAELKLFLMQLAQRM